MTRSTDEPARTLLLAHAVPASGTMAGVINIGGENAGDAFYRYKMPKLQARVSGWQLLWAGRWVGE